MAIQLRRGAYANFDPAKMLPAEVGVVTSGDPDTVDGKAAYVAFAAGDVKKLATVDDITTEIDSAVDEAVQRAEDVAESIEASAAQIETNRTDIAELRADLSEIEPGLSDDAKTALLNCFRHVAWVDADGQTYYDALYSALYAEAYPKILASFNPGLNVIYNADKLDTLKQYTIVKLYEDAQDTGTVIADNAYTLSGTLSAGSNVITVQYGNLTTYMNITGVVDFYNIWEWSTNDLLSSNQIGVWGSYNNNLGYNPSSTDNRRMVTTTRGLCPAIINPSFEYGDYYPIPVPNSATSVYVDITNLADAEFGYADWVYIPDTGKYTRVYNGPWTSNKTTVALSSGINRFFTLHIRRNSNNDLFEVSPIVTVLFS